jgi:hypothetical protein
MTQTLDSLIGEVEAGEQHLTYEGLKGRTAAMPIALSTASPRCWSA